MHGQARPIWQVGYFDGWVSALHCCRVGRDDALSTGAPKAHELVHGLAWRRLSRWPARLRAGCGANRVWAWRHGVALIASANIHMHRGQTLQRRVEGECKVFSAECLNDANPIQAIVVFQCSQCAVRQQHLHCAALHTPPHRSATYESPCPRRVWCELAGHYSPHRRARGHARRTRCALCLYACFVLVAKNHA